MKTAVEVSSLTKKFGDFTAVDAVSFSVPRGEIFGFVGPNGAGKSTTIKMLCGILVPTSSSGRVAGADIMNYLRQFYFFIPIKFQDSGSSWQIAQKATCPIDLLL